MGMQEGRTKSQPQKTPWWCKACPKECSGVESESSNSKNLRGTAQNCLTRANYSTKRCMCQTMRPSTVSCMMVWASEILQQLQKQVIFSTAGKTKQFRQNITWISWQFIHETVSRIRSLECLLRISVTFPFASFLWIHVELFISDVAKWVSSGSKLW